MNEELKKILRLILKEELLPVTRYLKQIDKRVECIESDVRVMKTDIAVLKSDVDVLKGDVRVLKNDVDELKGDVRVLKNDVDVLKGDVEILKGDVDVLKIDVKELKNGQKQLNKNLIDCLGAYTEKIIKHFDNQTSLLNKRIFAVETELKGIAK